ncbi:MAG: hypothetical protein KGD63_04520 [Candidatus Lokiarchaeota archaeon]|nr:hypothetical protein [Candidatus Lokiarchaeota archaeon]
MVIHIKKTWSNKEKDIYKKINEIIYCLLTLAFALYYPFLIFLLGKDYSGLILGSAVDDFILLGNIFIVGEVSIIFLWAISAKIGTKKNPKLLETKNNYERFKQNLLENYSRKNKLKRKCYHMLPFTVVGIIPLIFYLSFSNLGDIWISYALFFIAIVGVDFAFTFIIGDVVRLLDFSYMPSKAANLFKAAMTDEELETFTSTSVMVFGFGPFIFFNFTIFFIVVLISAIADAFASIIGLISSKYNHIFPKGTTKTIEGYLGGIIVCFLCTLFGAYYSNMLGLSNWKFNSVLLIAIILSITFFLIDLITSKIKLQDNYINSLTIGSVLLITLILLKIPIF